MIGVHAAFAVFTFVGEFSIIVRTTIGRFHTTRFNGLWYLWERVKVQHVVTYLASVLCLCGCQSLVIDHLICNSFEEHRTIQKFWMNKSRFYFSASSFISYNSRLTLFFTQYQPIFKRTSVASGNVCISRSFSVSASVNIGLRLLFGESYNPKVLCTDYSNSISFLISTSWICIVSSSFIANGPVRYAH
jgi:hypothetical protein